MRARQWGWLAAMAMAIFLIPASARPPAKRSRPAKAAKRQVAAAFDPVAVNDASRTPVLGPGARGAAALRAQILLDRAHFSPGEIDGSLGANTVRALTVYQEVQGLPVTGKVDPATWAVLNKDAAVALIAYTVTAADAAGPFAPVPPTMEEKAKQKELGFESMAEMLGEKFHLSPALLAKLNPGRTLDQAGVELQVPNVERTPLLKSQSLEVSKSKLQVRVIDEQGKVMAAYPASIGSEHDPLPVGDWKLVTEQRNPEFHYNPALFWDAKATDAKATIPPGPNNPVGIVWLGLSKEHYGIHGTPEPGTIGRGQSHGCIRLTNWDAADLANMVKPGTPAHLTE